MISESHSDWNRCPERSSLRAGDVDVRLGRHPDVADGVRALELPEPVLVGDALGVTEVLHDLERLPEREHLAPGHVLEVVRQPLQVAVVAQRRPEGVLGVELDVHDLGAQLAHARLDLGPVALEALGELEVTRVVGVGQREAHEHEVRRGPVEGVPGRVGTAVLHGLEHPRHVGTERTPAVAVPVDDSCDSAHSGAS
jgi:hypothetical protein